MWCKKNAKIRNRKKKKKKGVQTTSCFQDTLWLPRGREVSVNIYFRTSLRCVWRCGGLPNRICAYVRVQLRSTQHTPRTDGEALCNSSLVFLKSFWWACWRPAEAYLFNKNGSLTRVIGLVAFLYKSTQTTFSFFNVHCQHSRAKTYFIRLKRTFKSIYLYIYWHCIIFLRVCGRILGSAAETNTFTCASYV